MRQSPTEGSSANSLARAPPPAAAVLALRRPILPGVRGAGRLQTLPPPPAGGPARFPAFPRAGPGGDGGAAHCSTAPLGCAVGAGRPACRPGAGRGGREPVPANAHRRRPRRVLGGSQPLGAGAAAAAPQAANGARSPWRLPLCSRRGEVWGPSARGPQPNAAAAAARCQAGCRSGAVPTPSRPQPALRAATIIPPPPLLPGGPTGVPRTIIRLF